MLKFLNYIKFDLLFLPLIKFSHKIQLFEFKKAMGVRRQCSICLKYQLRLLIPDAKLEGYNEKLDSELFLAVLKLLSPEIFMNNPPSFFKKKYSSEEILSVFEKRKAEYEKMKGEVDCILKKVEKIPEILKQIKRYNLLLNYASSLAKDKTEADYYFKKHV